MTPLDQTDVLPRPAETEDPEPARPRLGLLIVVLAGLLVILVASLGVIAETVARAEVQRIGVEEVRARLDAPASERIQVDIAGSVLLQELVGRYDRIGVTVYSFPTGRANADLTMTIEGARRVDDAIWADKVSGAVTLTAAQATALLLPADAQGEMRVGFSDGDMVVSGSVLAGTTPVTVSAAVTPHFENGRVSAAFSSLMVGDKTLSLDEVAAQAGIDLSTLQPAPACVAETMPSFLHPRDVRVTDQQLRMEFDVDLAASDTAEGRAPGSCP